MKSSNDPPSDHEDEQQVPLLGRPSSSSTVTGASAVAEVNEALRQRQHGPTSSGNLETGMETHSGVFSLTPPEGVSPASSILYPRHASLNSNAATRITQPNPSDILLGRGKPYQHHSGNEAMRRLVEQHKDMYNRLPRDKRGIVANKLMDQLQGDGVRFLKRDDTVKNGGWEVAESSEAYEKLCHALRAKAPRKKRRAIDHTPSEGVPFLSGQSTMRTMLSSTPSSALTPRGCSPQPVVDHSIHQQLDRSSSSATTQQRPDFGPRTDTNELHDLAIRMALAKYLGSRTEEENNRKSKDKKEDTA